ncbi:MAG TPA: DivIVA domain-containing protein, partial [Acidimicrobiales bacterium]|nr:DivIVA domain-containing protein [Acidimicrobiales bacterium]
MDSTEHVTSALDAIETVAFKVGLKGYNVDEVDDFLERLATETRQLKDLVQQQRQQLRQASERIAQLDARGPVTAMAPPTAAPVARAGTGSAEQVTSMIAMAQQFIESAQQEAETKAKELTTAAQERAREIVAEARSRAEDEVNRLNGLKQRLSEDVDTLARQLDAERARLGGWLAEFTRWVESSLQVDSSPKAPARESAPPPHSTAPA